jgi:hypothetical protein
MGQYGITAFHITFFVVVINAQRHFLIKKGAVVLTVDIIYSSTSVM